jgi:hypothetical protein
MKISYSLVLTSYLTVQSFFGFGQNDKNHIITTTPLQPTQSETSIDNLPILSKNITINFASETGQLIQNKSNSGQLNGKYLVRKYEYDSSLRLIKEYEPAIDNSNTPTFIENFDILTTNTYSGANNICQNNYPYSEFEYENSPLNSLLKSSAPGDSWVISGSHTSRQKQLVATSDDYVMNLYYDGSIKQSVIPIPNESGNSNITHGFSSTSQFQGLVEWNTNHVFNGEIIYRGGEQLLGSNKNLVSFSGLNPNSFYFLRYKIAKEGESSAIIVGIKGLFSSTYSTLTNSNGNALEHSAGPLSNILTLYESSIITGVDEILFTTYGPVGTFSDVIKILYSLRKLLIQTTWLPRSFTIH